MTEANSKWNNESNGFVYIQSNDRQRQEALTRRARKRQGQNDDITDMNALYIRQTVLLNYIHVEHDFNIILANCSFSIVYT